MILSNKRNGSTDTIFLLLIILLFTLCVFMVVDSLAIKRYRDPYYKLDRQSIDFNGIRYKINRNSELEIYKTYTRKVQYYNSVLRTFTTTTNYTYSLIKKISFDISEVN